MFYVLLSTGYDPVENECFCRFDVVPVLPVQPETEAILGPFRSLEDAQKAGRVWLAEQPFEDLEF